MVVRHPENPLITPADVTPSHPEFEVVGVFNAGAALVGKRTVLVLRVAERVKQKNTKIIMIPHLTFRAARAELSTVRITKGDPRYVFSDPRKLADARLRDRPVRYLTSLSHLQLAWSDDGVHFSVERRPWIFPSVREEAWGCEDARVTNIGGTYWVNYTAVSDLGIATALASTRTFRRVRRAGIIFEPPNRDVAIFPHKIGGQFAALHRPMPGNIGVQSVWYGDSPDLLHWGHHRSVIQPRPGLWDGAKVGGGAPPMHTKKGWLALYHGVDAKGRYSLGALLLDHTQPWKVLGRSRRPLLAPAAPYERRGFYRNVCFTCGVTEHDGDLWIYYGAADKVMALAAVPIKEVLRRLK